VEVYFAEHSRRNRRGEVLVGQIEEHGSLRNHRVLLTLDHEGVKLNRVVSKVFVPTKSMKRRPKQREGIERDHPLLECDVLVEKSSASQKKLSLRDLKRLRIDIEESPVLQTTLDPHEVSPVSGLNSI